MRTIYGASTEFGGKALHRDEANTGATIKQIEEERANPVTIETMGNMLELLEQDVATIMSAAEQMIEGNLFKQYFDFCVEWSNYCDKNRSGRVTLSDFPPEKQRLSEKGQACVAHLFRGNSYSFESHHVLILKLFKLQMAMLNHFDNSDDMIVRSQRLFATLKKIDEYLQTIGKALLAYNATGKRVMFDLSSYLARMKSITLFPTMHPFQYVKVEEKLSADAISLVVFCPKYQHEAPYFTSPLGWQGVFVSIFSNVENIIHPGNDVPRTASGGSVSSSTIPGAVDDLFSTREGLYLALMTDNVNAFNFIWENYKTQHGTPDMSFAEFAAKENLLFLAAETGSCGVLESLYQLGATTKQKFTFTCNEMVGAQQVQRQRCLTPLGMVVHALNQDRISRDTAERMMLTLIEAGEEYNAKVEDTWIENSGYYSQTAIEKYKKTDLRSFDTKGVLSAVIEAFQESKKSTQKGKGRAQHGAAQPSVASDPIQAQLLKRITALELENDRLKAENRRLRGGNTTQAGAARAKPAPCHFFNTPSGCLKGNSCTFAHDNTGDSPGPAKQGF